MNFVVPPVSPVVIPLVGADACFPVRRVYCVGQNYALHVAEMGGDVRVNDRRTAAPVSKEEGKARLANLRAMFESRAKD